MVKELRVMTHDKKSRAMAKDRRVRREWHGKRTESHETNLESHVMSWQTMAESW
jgi:hypothetical protein